MFLLFAYSISMATAFVTGASRGVGRGIAAELAAQGFKVFATGRSIDSAELPASVQRIRCDHTRDADLVCRLLLEITELDTDLATVAANGDFRLNQEGMRAYVSCMM